MLCRAFSLSAMLRQTEPSKGRVRNVKRSATELSGGGPPSWIRTNDLSLRGEVTALCSVGSGWRMVRRFVRRRPWVMSGLVKKAAWQGERARFVFMRSNRALQRRQLVQHGCSNEELARTEGFEPPPSGSVIRRIIQLCYVRVVRPQVTVGQLVETAGNAPAATILQGSSAPLCCPHSLVPGARIERAPPDFQSGAMTSSATQAYR